MTETELFAEARIALGESGKTQSQVAEELGITQAAVSFGLSRSPGTAIDIIRHCTGRRIVPVTRYEPADQTTETP